MSKKRSGLVCIALLAALLVLWVAKRQSTDSSGMGPSDPGIHAPGLQRGEPSEVATATLKAEAPMDSTGLASESRIPVVLGEFRLEDARWIEGLVRLPEGLPKDEEVHVLAMDERGDAGALGLGREPREKAPRSLSRARVEASGAFRVPVPPDATSVHLSVRGHYLYSARSTEVPTQTTEAVLLEPVLGAWIVGRLQEPERDGADLDFEARLSIHPEGLSNMFDGSAWARRVVRGRAGQFEFEGVAVEEPLRVVAISDELAAATSDRIQLSPGQRLTIELASAPGGIVRGVVLDAQGEPFPAVDVFALDDANFLAGRTGRRVRETLTDATGRFELRGVAAGAMSIRAEFPQHLIASTRVEILPGETVEGVELVLTRGRGILGKVVGPDGLGRAGAEVTATFDVGQLGGMEGLSAIRGNFQRYVSDADGGFLLSGLGRGPFTVHATWVEDQPAEQDVKPGEAKPRAAGFTERAFSARADRVAPDGEELELKLSAPLALAGLVLLPGAQPAQAFQVQASRSGESLVAEFGKEVIHRDFESVDGSFQLWGLRPGSWTVLAHAPGCAPSDEITVSLPQTENALPVQFNLRAEARVSGRVLTPDGQPAVGAQVELASNSLQKLSKVYHSLGEERALTDANGAFDLGGLSAGNVALVARAQGWAESQAVEVELLDGLPSEDIVLRLRKGATLTGEAYNARGTPAVGDAIVAQIPGSIDMIQTSTDAHGKFRFEDVYPGKWQVVALPHEDHIAEVLAEDGGGVGRLIAGVRMRIVELAEGAEAHVILGEPLPDPVRVSGRVTLDNLGVPGVVVSFVGTVAQAGSVRFESADADGRYEILLPAGGSYLMLVQRMGPVMAETSLEFRVEVPDRPEHEIDVEIPLGQLSGRVEGPGGEALAGVRVTLVGAKNNSQTFWGGHFTETETDGTGKYTVDWLRPGSYRVTAGGVRYGGMFGSPSPWGKGAGVLVEIRASEQVGDVDFRLQAGGSLVGIARDSYGEPVPGAAIYAYDSTGQPVERLTFVSTDNSGAYKFDGLAPGEYTLLARSEFMAGERSEVLFVQGQKATKHDLVLELGTLLEVEVHDTEGNPVEANVRVVDEDGFEVSGAISFGQLVSAMQGGSAKTLRQIGPLAAGRYVVSASLPGVGSAQRKKTLRGGESQRLVLRLK